MKKTNNILLNRFIDCIKFQFAKDRKLKYKVAMIIIILIGAIGIHMKSSNADTIRLDKTEKVKEKEHSQTSDEFYIDISGAVNSPGVYKVKKKTRVFELIEKAGGLKTDANLDAFNQAEFVKDGQKIVIPSNEGGDINREIDDKTNNDGGMININLADKSRLMSLPGVGDAIAQRIIDYRKDHRFSKVEDLKQVKGIGDATFEKLKNMITV
nr:helix-hairpin-helix domain-containing protein [uncultured Mogibacterium sp.]